MLPGRRIRSPHTRRPRATGLPLLTVSCGSDRRVGRPCSLQGSGPLVAAEAAGLRCLWSRGLLLSLLLSLLPLVRPPGQPRMISPRDMQLASVKTVAPPRPRSQGWLRRVHVFWGPHSIHATSQPGGPSSRCRREVEGSVRHVPCEAAAGHNGDHGFM